MDLERFGIYDAIDQHSIHKYNFVHDAIDRVVIEVGDCGIATDDACTNADKLPCENQVPIHLVQHQDIQLLASDVEVGLLNETC